VCVDREGEEEKTKLGVTLHEIGNFMLGGRAKGEEKVETGQLSNRWVLVAR